MPRYLIERSFPEGLAIPVDDQGAKTCLAVVDHNATEGSLGPFLCDPRPADDLLRL